VSTGERPGAGTVRAPPQPVQNRAAADDDDADAEFVFFR
jgi:hypothetical protein